MFRPKWPSSGVQVVVFQSILAETLKKVKGNGKAIPVTRHGDP
jgi:hypothetical protein